MTGECYFFEAKLTQNAGFCSSTPPSHIELRANDPVCPLRAVHCVVSSKNIWANMQQYCSPVLTNWNIGDPKLWKPFLTEKKAREYFPDGIATFQKLVNGNELIYAKPITNLQNLERRVQKYIVEMFQDERIKTVRKTTKWKFESQDTLRQILLQCEDQAKMARKGGTLS